MIRTVKKSNGNLQAFDPERINRWAEWADNFGVNWSEIALEAVKRCYDGCSTSDLQNAMISACVDKKTPAHSMMAGRILIGTVYKDAFGGFRKIPALKNFYHMMVSNGLWASMPYSDEELDELNAVINHSKDLTYGYSVVKQFCDKYSVKNVKTKKVYESPQFMFMGMSMYAMQNRPQESRIDDIKKLYTYVSDLKINPPTPYLNGLRVRNTGYASCCVIKSDDTAKSIGVAEHIAYEMTCKQAGIGIFLETRSIGDGVRHNTISHQGKLPYFRVIDSAVKANRQQTRGGSATVAFLAVDPEIDTLLRLNNPQTPAKKQIKQMDYQVGINKSLIKRAKANEDWVLASYQDCPELHRAMYKSYEEFEVVLAKVMADDSVNKTIVKARAVLKVVAKTRYESGRIYPFFPDNMNSQTPFEDTIFNSNLCFTGDTQVAVADGRNSVSIRDLAEHGEPFPVYSARQSKNNKSKWTTEIKQAIAKKTGYKAIITVKLSNGQEFRCTPDHPLALADARGSYPYVEAEKSVGMRLKGFFTSVHENKYRRINTVSDGNKNQHRMIYEFHNGAIPNRYQINHKDNSADFLDDIRNLECIHEDVHNIKTSQDFLGTGNPIHRRDVERSAHNYSVKNTLEGNPRYLGLTNQEILDIAWTLKMSDESITFGNMRGISPKCPKSFSKNRFGGKLSNLKALVDSGVKAITEPDRNQYIPVVNNSRVDMMEDPTVVSIEPYGYADVYDLYVEDNHNFFIITNGDAMNSEGILVHNCMEIQLPTKGFPDMRDLYNNTGNGEIALCFLASIVAGRVSKEEYEDVAYYTLLLIDCVIDLMEYPWESLRETAQYRRSVGVGITNLAHYLASNFTSYSSREGKKLMHELAELHSYSLHRASLRLAKELGVCKGMEVSKYRHGWTPVQHANGELSDVVDTTLQFDWGALSEEIKQNGGIRHSVLEAFMPNESSSLSTNTTNGLYPVRELMMYKKSPQGATLFLAPDMEFLDTVYQSAWDVPTRDLIDCYAIFQKFTGQAISADFYQDYTKTGRKVSFKQFILDLEYAHDKGMKTKYYMNSRVGVGKSALNELSCESCGV